MDILEVKKLNIDYVKSNETCYRVHDINFSLSKGKVIGIIGESGCGKSTIAKSLLKILPQNAYVQGEVLIDGVDILKLNEKQMKNIRGNTISMIFQDPKEALNPIRKIKHQFYDILEDYKKINGKSKTNELIEKKLKEVNLKDTKKILDSYSFELSGGMAQRVVIAMALIKEPKILIADEPTASIDAINRREIFNEIKKLEDMSIIMISHNLEEIYDMCDELIVIDKGVVVEQGDAKEIFNNPKHDYTKTLLQIGNLEGENYGEQMSS